MAALNLFFKWSLTLLLLLALPAGAVSLNALYTASCQREIGIILDVSPRKILLLNLKGEIVSVERFEVIYYATYALDAVPIQSVANPELVPLVGIKTFQDGDLVNLVKGWPVDFSKDKISFLNLRGSEVAIDRSSIWKVHFSEEKRDQEFSTRPAGRFEFVHPYAFNSCPAEVSGRDGKYVKIYPQQLLSEPIAIKREFDRLQEGHAQVRRYESDQQFYAVPELYTNTTALGLWTMYGARSGASHHRQSNFTPLLTNSYSSGPFGFQSELRTGSGPLLETIHEETQTQAYYRMKADYFHFTGMVDPNLLLVGTKYPWAISDLDSVDVRANESAFIEFGFDYNRIAVELFLGGAMNVAAQDGAFFNRDTVSLPRLGLRYQSYTWTAEFLVGSSNQKGYGTQFLRGNLKWEPNGHSRWVLSAIRRQIKFQGEDKETNADFHVETQSATLAASRFWRIEHRYWLGLALSAESLDKIDNSNVKTSHVYPKGAAMLSLEF